MFAYNDNMGLKILTIHSLGLFRVVGAVLLIASSLARGSGVPVIQLGHENYPDIAPYLSYGFEQNKVLSIDEVEGSIAWAPVGDATLNFGFGQQPLCLKMQINADRAGDQMWWVYLPYFALNKVDFYSLVNGQIVKHMQVGFDFDFSQRLHKHRNYHFPIHASGSATIYFRVEATGALYVPLQIWARDDFSNNREKNNLLYGAYAGVILAMVIYNLFLFSAIKESIYLAYIAYVVSYFMLMMTNEGFSFQYLWPNNPGFNISASPIFASLAGCLALDFSIRFLEVKRYSAVLNYILRGAMGVCLLLGVLAFFSSADLNVLVNGLSVLFTFVIVVASVHCYRKGCTQAFYFMLAWIFLLTGIFVFACVMNGWIPSNFITQNALFIGSVAEVLMFSFALANRINVIKDEKNMVLQMQQQTLNGLKQAEMEIYEVAFKDRLTGLPNRERMSNLLNKRLRVESQAERVYLLIIHLKQLQEINKTLGYRVGDDLLVKIALTLRKECEYWLASEDLGLQFDPESDLGALEGANFVLVVKSINDVVLEKLCQKVLALFDKPVSYGDMSIDVGVCVGYSPVTDKANDFDGLLKNAQVAVETALEKSIGFICYSEGLDPYSEKRITLMADLKAAILQDGLDLYLQPKMNLHLQKVQGFEALIRWNHEKHGFVSPVEFIPLAEKSGIINDLTDWVVHKSLSYIQFFNERNLYPSISVNISAKNLQQPFFAEQIVNALKRKDIDPSSLVLEITETAMMDDPDKALACLHHLKQYGFKVSLDDFGTGYSSLSYLSRLPIAEIKIDRSFVKDIEAQETPVIVETTLQMAKGLNLETVAEGIENEEALMRLQELGCDIVQGYYLARPMPFGDLIEWLSQQKGYESLRFHSSKRDVSGD